MLSGKFSCAKMRRIFPSKSITILSSRTTLFRVCSGIVYPCLIFCLKESSNSISFSFSCALIRLGVQKNSLQPLQLFDGVVYDFFPTFVVCIQGKKCSDQCDHLLLTFSLIISDNLLFFCKFSFSAGKSIDGLPWHRFDLLMQRFGYF